VETRKLSEQPLLDTNILRNIFPSEIVAVKIYGSSIANLYRLRFQMKEM
jgi:hypothetical protein